MEKYLNETENKSITDTWNLSTPSDLYDKEILLYTIMNRGGTLEPIEYDPDSFYTDCAYFWVKWKRTIDKWIEALQIEYNPLENYDRQEDWTDANTDTGSHTVARNTTEVTDDDSSTTQTDNTRTVLAESGSASKTGTESTTGNSSNTSRSDTEELISAFNASELVENKETIVNGSGSENSTSTTTYNITDSNSHDSTTTNDGTVNITGADDKTVTTTESINNATNDTKNGTHSGRIHGNIGVTTSQQMLRAELDLQYWNVYEHIADLFIGELTTRVY